MVPLVLVGAVLAAPVLILTFLRANAMMVFLSLCLGSVLVRFISDDADNTIGILALGTGHSNQSLVALCLLFAPAVLTTVFTMGSVRNPTRRLLNFILSFAVACLVVVLAEPYFSSSIQTTLSGNPIWHYVEKLQTLLIAVGALLTLLLLWMQRPQHHDDKKHH